MVEENESVSENGHGEGLEMAELHGDPLGEVADQLASDGGPADGVGRAARHVVYVDTVRHGNRLEEKGGVNLHFLFLFPYPTFLFLSPYPTFLFLSLQLRGTRAHDRTLHSIMRSCMGNKHKLLCTQLQL